MTLCGRPTRYHAPNAPHDIFGPQPTFTCIGGEEIPISATVPNDGACNNEFVIHFEGTTDATQPLPPSPGIMAVGWTTIHP